ncbi:MAG: hypothetical protein H0T79_19825, partial [Deltaproteobacteria bacterium]|nr:hypothetical protein [Deltaproteobacteria bacterium]
FERIALDLGGSLDEVWALLAASYETHALDAGALRAAFVGAVADLVVGDRIPCVMVVWLAIAEAP